MDNARGEPAEPSEPLLLSEPEDIWTWVFFSMGVACQGAFVDSGDKERDRRARWGSLMMGQLVPAIAAALKVAMRHPEEFREELGDPIVVERMP